VAVAPVVDQIVASAIDSVMSKVVISPNALDRFRQAASRAARGVKPVSRWLTVKDDIAALRKCGLSYRAISDLLSQNGISASPSGLMRFCRRVLKEKPSHKPSVKRPSSRRARVSASSKGTPAVPAKVPPLPAPASADLPAFQPDEIPVFTSCEPHIAKVELLPPGEEI
jgi:hypothetical protein